MASHHPRILLIEDDPAVARMMVELLHAADYEVDGPYTDASDGIAALASHFPDGAVVDLHRASEGAGLLKDDLAAYDIPFFDCSKAGRTSATRRAGSRSQLENRLLPWLKHMRH